MKGKNKLYGIGVGPGDKRLLTLHAVETLKFVDKIVVPDTKGENTALNIVAEYIQDKEKIFCHLPMTRDEETLKNAHQEAANQIIQKLELGYNVGFITLGDPTIYSTYIYIHRLVLERGYEAEIINGIPSFCAVAAKLNISLCDKEESLHIIPASYDEGKEMLELKGNKVLMKNGKALAEIIGMLKENGELHQAKMVERCCMKDERIYEQLDDVEESSYFSVIVVKG